MKRLAFALALLAPPAMAQDSVPETVEVVGLHTLAGIWKIHFPAGLSLTIPLGLRTLHAIYGGREAFCRMEQGRDALAVRCLPWNGDGTASLADGRLHLAWGTALFRFVIDAPIVSATTFMGAYKLKVFGDSHETSMPASGRKLTPFAAAPDAAGQGAALRAALAAIASGAAPPPDEPTRRRFGSLFGGAPAMSAASLQSLGALAQVIYLGVNTPAEAPPGSPPKSEKPPQQPGRQPDYYQGYGLYDVEFANGARLCGVHADQGGKIDVLCV